MRVASLHRYPVKSMLGEELVEAVVTERGLLGDRGHGLVDTADGTVVSAKHPRKWAALLRLTARYVDEPVAGAPLPPVAVTVDDGTVLRNDAPGTDAALSRLLGREVRLTSEAPPGSRFEEQWPAIEGLAPAGFIAGTTTSHEGDEPVSSIDLGMLAPPGTFFDLAVLHVLTTSTLARLAALTPGPAYEAARYRPNVVLEGAPEGFAEDAWTGQELRLGDQVRASVSMPTMRCVMTTLAQGDLPEDRDTLRGIAKHHRVEIAGLGTWACAGAYAAVTAQGVLRTGDSAAV